MMKFKITLLPALLALPLFTQATCNVPETLSGKIFINKTGPLWSVQNPNADSLLRLEFTDDTYTSHFLRTGDRVQGKYRYEVFKSQTGLAHSVGVLEAEEDFQGQTTLFTLTLVCLGDRTGTFVYNQRQGAIKPDVRQNTGIWIVQDPAS